MSDVAACVKYHLTRIYVFALAMGGAIELRSCRIAKVSTPPCCNCRSLRL